MPVYSVSPRKKNRQNDKDEMFLQRKGIFKTTNY